MMQIFSNHHLQVSVNSSPLKRSLYESLFTYILMMVKIKNKTVQVKGVKLKPDVTENKLLCLHGHVEKMTAENNNDVVPS
jgi:hypothetical protein